MGGSLSTRSNKKGKFSPETTPTPTTPVDDESSQEGTPRPEAVPSGGKRKSELRKKVFAMLDPRSPTVEIVRTPINIEEEKENAMKNPTNGDMTPTCGEKPLPFSKGRLATAFIDPRSPTQEINRTPIQLQFEPKSS